MTQEDRPPITDLRSALQRLADHPGQLIETDHPVDPNGELAGVYRRERVGILFDSPPNRLTQRMAEAYRDAIAPVKFSGERAPCQQVVHRADEPGFDLRTILPAPTNTDRDAGPFFCLGLVLGSDPELGTDVTIHRLCVQGRDEMSIFFVPSPAYRRFPGTCRGGRTAVPHLGQHGPGPGDPHQRRIRGPHHPGRGARRCLSFCATLRPARCPRSCAGPRR